MKFKIKDTPDEIYRGWKMFFEYEDRSSGIHTNGPSIMRARCTKGDVEIIVIKDRHEHNTRMSARKEIDNKENI